MEPFGETGRAHTDHDAGRDVVPTELPLSVHW